VILFSERKARRHVIETPFAASAKTSIASKTGNNGLNIFDK
jgi:hypothetical protein